MWIKAYYYPARSKWFISCYVCMGRIKYHSSGGAYHDVADVMDRAREHLLSHAAGAIRP